MFSSTVPTTSVPTKGKLFSRGKGRYKEKGNYEGKSKDIPKPNVYKKKHAKSSSKPLVCWNCEKKGHTRNSCKVKRKINVVPISSDKKQRYLDLLSDNDNSELELLKLEESEPLSEWEIVTKVKI